MIQQHSVAGEETASGDGREGTEYGGDEMVLLSERVRESWMEKRVQGI